MTQPSPGKRRGGYRPNAGRKRHKPAAAAASKASKDVSGDVLDSIDQIAYWREHLYAGMAFAQLTIEQKRERREALVYLTNRYHGKPAEKIEGSFDPDKPFVLTIEHIGRNPRQAPAPTAKAK